MTDEINYQIIYVTGPDGAGKSTFVKTIGESDLLVDPGLTTYNACLLTVGEDTFVYLIARPENLRDDWVWDTIRHHALGIIIVVNSRNSQDFSEETFLLEGFRKVDPDAPMVIAANFQDHPDAMSPDDLRSALHVPDDVPVVPCVATDHESVRNVLIQLLHMVVGKIDDEDKLRQAGLRD